MAGDWIKMRDNLWDDPRVAAMVDLTDSSEAAIIGALYWLWATADQHTEDGVLQGLTVRGIDRKTGVKGFGEALISIGWLIDHPDGVQIVDFEKHNGSSAKKRCQVAKRVAVSRIGNADVTLPALQNEPSSVTGALAREREEREKRREESEDTHTGGPAPVAPSQAVAACVVIKAAGISSVNSSHPDLSVLLDAGAGLGQFAEAAQMAAKKRKGFAYVLGIVRGQLADAQALADSVQAGGGLPGAGKTQPESFRERDDRIARERWEQMTGQTHPDNLPKTPANVIDITPAKSLALKVFQ